MPKFRTPSLSLPVAATVIAGVVVLSAASGAGAARLITGAQIKNNTVTGVDIKNGSLTSLDIAASARAALTGPAGPAGAKGDAGAPGSPGINGYTLVTGTEQTVPAAASGIPGSNLVRVLCPAGLRVISGGAYVVGGVSGASALTSNQPDAVNGAQQPINPNTENANAWSASAKNSGASDSYLRAYAICANIS